MRWGSPTGRCWTGGLPRCSSEDNEPVTSLAVPAAVLSRARGVANDFRDLTGVEVDAEEIIAGRAGLLGLSPRGRISAGGATRLMRSRDGWCALTLSRPDDVDAVPALLQSDAVGRRPWPAVQRWVAERRLRRSHRAGTPARPSGRRARRDAVRTAAHLPLRRGDDSARPIGAPRRRPVRDVGGPALRTVVGAGGRDRRQGRDRSPPRRCPLRSIRVLRLDEQRKALVHG